MPAALCYADVGPAAGLGHFQRSVALACALRERGWSVRMLAADTPWVRRRLETVGLGFSKCDASSQAWKQLAEAPEQAIVCDSYQADGTDGLEACRRAGKVVMRFDDLAHEALPCDLVVNASPAAARLPYASANGHAPRRLLGPAYAVLLPEFWDVPQRDLATTSRQILVSFGGAMAVEHMPALIEALGSQADGRRVSVVCGPFMPPQPIAEAARSCRAPVEVIAQPASLHRLMQQADLAVCGGGHTLMELARMGCPAVAMSLSPNQTAHLRAFAEAGCVVEASLGAPELIARQVEALLADPLARASMSQAGQRLINGQGARRVAQELERFMR